MSAIPLTPVEAVADTANYNAKTYPYTAADEDVIDNTLSFVGIAVQDAWAPEEHVVLQMQKHKRVRSSVRWAELPDCEGEDGEIELSE